MQFFNTTGSGNWIYLLRIYIYIYMLHPFAIKKPSQYRRDLWANDKNDQNNRIAGISNKSLEKNFKLKSNNTLKCF